jgi:hypothetical protein
VRIYIVLSLSGVDALLDQDGFQEVLGRGKRSRNTERMDALIQAEDDEEDRLNQLRRRTKCKPKAKPTTVDDNNFFSSLPIEESSDDDDDDFDDPSGSESSSETSSVSSSNKIEEITNAEVHYLQLL